MGVWFAVFGFRDTVAIASSAMASLVTLGAVYGLGRRLYGARASLVAVAFLSGNLYNVTFARQAITDAAFQCLFVLTVYALLVWIAEGRRRWLLMSGIALSLCENVKYHGFFAWLVIALWTSWHVARGSIPWRVAAGRLLGSALIALAMVSPWLLLISHHYGPGWIVRHYLGYSVGAAGSRGTPLDLWTYLSLWCGPLFLLLASVGLIRAIGTRRPEIRVLILWLLLVGVGSCLYKSYPRLLLPMTSALALLAGWAVKVILDRFPHRWLLASICGLGLVTEGIQAWPRIGPFGSGYRAAGTYLATRPWELSDSRP